MKNSHLHMGKVQAMLFVILFTKVTNQGVDIPTGLQFENKNHST